MHEIIGEKFVNHQAEGLSTDFKSETRIVCFGHVLNGSGRNKQYL
jgi:hypothetical protein